jgi:plastocyanin
VKTKVQLSKPIYIFGSLGMFLFFLAFEATTTTNFVHGQNQTQLSNVTIVSDASTLGDKSFQPNPLEIPAGSTVIWTNDDFGIHTVTDNDGAFDLML